MPDTPDVIDDPTTGADVEPGEEPATNTEWWRRRSSLVLLGVAALVAVLYGVGVLLTYNSVPRGTTVAGIAVGGQDAGGARAVLAETLVPRESEPIPIVAGTATEPLDPVTAGLSLDVDATVSAALDGSSWNPAHIVRAVFGGGAVAPVTESDDAGLAQAVAALADKLDITPINGAVSFDDGKVTRTEPVDGVVIDRTKAAAAIRAGFLRSDKPIVVPAEVTAPAIDKAELDRAVADFATPAMSGPVTLQAGSTTVSLPTAAIAPFLTLVSDAAGTLTPSLDAAGLIAAQTDLLAPLVKAPKNASFTFVDDKPVVVPSEDGTALNAPTLATDLIAVLPKAGADRVASATVSTKEADLTTGEANVLGIIEPISEFTTQYPIAPYRLTNIGRAAELINGSVVLPGATWSLNQTVGERTEANGFVKGFIIDGGQFREDFGGGVSQVATTTFNAVFFAGLQDVEHKPHSFYISRYPAGREATVAWPTVDLQFRNDTQTGVLIQEIATPGQITVRFWGTKAYDEIKSVSSAKTNFTSGTTRVESGDLCVPQDPVQGFDITVTRQFVNAGQVVKSEDFHTHYNPADRVICN